MLGAEESVSGQPLPRRVILTTPSLLYASTTPIRVASVSKCTPQLLVLGDGETLGLLFRGEHQLRGFDTLLCPAYDNLGARTFQVDKARHISEHDLGRGRSKATPAPDLTRAYR